MGVFQSHSSAPRDMVTFSFARAIENTTDLKAPDDKRNADAVLARLRAFADQPEGWKPREIAVRPGVLAYLRLHAIKVFNERPCADGMMCATVIV